MAGRWTTTTKIVVGVFVVAGVCSMVWTMHAIRPRPTGMSQPTPTPQASNPVQIPPEEVAYQGILEKYRGVLDADSKAFLETPEQYYHGDHAVLQMYHGNRTRYQGDSFFYTYYDLDDNGTEELLIGFGWDGWINENPRAAQLVDLYTFDGTKAIEALDAPDLGDETSIEVLNDGTLLHISINNNGQTVCSYLQVEGCTVKETNTMITDPDTVASMEVKGDLNWRTIS